MTGPAADRQVGGAPLVRRVVASGEAAIIISGRGNATSKGEVYDLSPGDMLLTEAGI